jgi:SAM-dependent methyltransferase
MIAPGRRGLGFGVGKEMTVAVLAARGVRVTATDLDLTAAGPEWVDTGQHAAGLADLNDKWICPTDLFAQLVEFRVEDMNAISRDLEGYDFAWSLCAFEHLGSLEHGLNFVKNSLRCIRPGGILVHTSEFNCSSDDATLDTGPAVLFRKRDYLQLAEELTREGHHLEVNFNLGGGELDDYVDEAPWNDRRHLRLRLGGFVSTSFGLIIRKAG